MLGVKGWFSTNILGNRDGEVLDDPQSFKTKEESKLGSLEYIFQPELYPDLYKDIYHKIRINYYPPRGDEKEAWDNIDIFGWLGYPMQIKVNFLCRDSILAAPIALDLVLFLDLAKRTPELRSMGIQEWLSFYLKSPQTRRGTLSGARSVYPVDEAEEHAAPHHGRGPDHASRAGVLRLGGERRACRVDRGASFRGRSPHSFEGFLARPKPCPFKAVRQLEPVSKQKAPSARMGLLHWNGRGLYASAGADSMSGMTVVAICAEGWAAAGCACG